MSLFLIDTDIASFIFKGSDYAAPYLPLLSGQELALSFMTVAELFQWANPTSVGRSATFTARTVPLQLHYYPGRSAPLSEMGADSL
jgi:predicted nucleic acid-binding protein